MSKKTFKTLEEAMEFCFFEEIEADILALPPEVDELTDEVEFDDDILGAPIVNDVPGDLEIDIIDNNSDHNGITQDADDDDDEWEIPLATLFGRGVAKTCEASSHSISGSNQLPSKKLKMSKAKENLSVDEMIVLYYGHHSLKQFIRAKPIRFGYKLWAMCGNDGYCFNFSLYCGKEKTDTTDPLGTRVVQKMLSVVEDPKNHFVYFDNFFSSHSLLSELKDLGFRATGTIRENRTQKCPLKSTKELEKDKRGAYDYQFDKKKYLSSTSAPRWNREKKSVLLFLSLRLSIIITDIWGGVGKHDWLLEKHHISARGKKWYWCLVTRVIDMAVVNAFLLYRAIHGKKSISIKDFRRSIAVEYLKIGYGKRILKGRPLSFPSTSTSSVPDGVRYDERGHFLEKREKERRCQYKNCSGKPLTFCSKCNSAASVANSRKKYIKNINNKKSDKLLLKKGFQEDIEYGPVQDVSYIDEYYHIKEIIEVLELSGFNTHIKAYEIKD
ncbi:hypothetical protein NQ315_016274, partial [Exocentrus adspersus]